MAYCLSTDLLAWIEKAALVQLCSDGDEAAVSDDEVTAVLDAAIKTAGAKIDSYLIGRYGTQLRTGTTPPSVQVACAQLAVYYLYLRRRSIDDDWQANFDELILWLTDLRDGKGDLLASEATGAAIDEPYNAYRHDAENIVDSDLPTNDARYYAPSKQKKIFGV